MNKTETPGLQPGKYREIVLAVACFLIFDLAVLMLNFYTSYQISADAVAINLGGRQRMLSQRMAKAALMLETAQRNGQPEAAVLEELDAAVTLFDASLTAFIAGGPVKGADGRMARLDKVQDAGGREILGKASELWQSYRESLRAAVKQPGDEALVAAAAVAARTYNIRLLGMMNDLTVRLESVASAKAERLRQVQTAGIVLALLNFGFILLKFIRRLRESDERSAAAQRETSEILGTVREGLFLIDRHFRLGSQYSASLSGLLGRQIAAGDDFRPILRELMGPDDYEQAVQYASLLLGERVKEVLVRELNPMREVGVITDKGAKYLSFEFNRVLVDGKLTHLLVTVGDVSEQVALRNALDSAKSRADEQMNVMLRLLQMQPATLQEFINEASAGLFEINDRLKAVTGRPGEYRAMIGHVFRVVHSIKGNAAMLGLDFMVTDAHVFEDQLEKMRGRDQLSGEELISLSVSLQKLFERLGWLRSVVAKYAEQPEPVPVRADFQQSIVDLTRRVADDQDKRVLTHVSLDPLEMLPPAAASTLRVIAAQLVRNAVVHGIESPSERVGSGKPVEGLVQVELSSSGPDQFILSVRDDGRGLCAKRLREVLRETGRMDETMLAQLSDRQIIMEIFKRGFSTAGKVDDHAGRGVGLDVVSHAVKRIGGRVRLLSQPGRYTEFRVEFAA
ncbi:type IV pili methyl-accepting chemotaxis transducer N-terminal domain-containing protein [Uliginosibacterium sp. 31-16]|uniref:type IV pili methyl-accepting chemotaxis transducer N-terminal domain-containing protein n=1 Tax=Uliginosibacterium sp. 31-16 TaxID=3068315 RepID=UPI00273E1101|nr:type IV pili methyl-accepting chemotaxis transducer N-terminal domain-containing protein [Uliginosibacterium sp. 31-16]MDP5239748.1 type IV pili methyl-accepting chemotaxis transducer N-terminal domain-containing protein [Uliginosibacterium sp. 31-16]